MHNVQNALAAIAVGREVGVADAAIAKALAEFHGVGRRFQRYGDVALEGGGAFTLIDDYGHHPAEMAATIAAVRGSFPGRRLVLAFQPHRYTRTRDLFEDFVQVLSTADALVLTEVYPAGEPPIVAADGRALARAVRVAGKVEPVFVERVAELPAAIRALVRDGDVVVTMGAGSIGQVAGHAGGRGMMMSEPLTFTALRGTLARDVAARALHELALRRPAATASTCRPIATTSRRSSASCRRGEPLTAIGLGSNCWCATAACAAPSSCCTPRSTRSRCADGLIYAEAGVASPKVARFAATHGCADAEFLAGIPGTVGGALAMNAGCYGGETWRYVARVEVLTRAGTLRGAAAAGVRDRLPLGAPRRRRRARRHLHRGVVRVSAGRRPRRARADHGAAARGASRRSRSTCRTPAACSAIRPATTRRG